VFLSLRDADGLLRRHLSPPLKRAALKPKITIVKCGYPPVIQLPFRMSFSSSASFT
jgi:hypothetical protein